MKNNFFNHPLDNIYSKPSSKSEITSQILYGEKFKILKKSNKWIKIKTSYDSYTGFIKRRNFSHNFNPTKKIYKLKSKIFRRKKKKFFPTKNFLYFGSGISIKKKTKKFIEFEKNKWIKIDQIKDINHHERNYLKIFKSYLNTKYLWGGKTSKGIDCSALIQIFFYYNRVYFPRDTRDQVKFCKKKLGKKFIKGDILFWKGHVGICTDKKNFIHAYGPKKKVVIMPIKITIDMIGRTANLKVKKKSNLGSISFAQNLAY